MMTPMKRLSVKKEPKTMKKTKYKYIQSRTSRWCCSSFYSTLAMIITHLLVKLTNFSCTFIDDRTPQVLKFR